MKYIWRNFIWRWTLMKCEMCILLSSTCHYSNCFSTSGKDNKFQPNSKKHFTQKWLKLAPKPQTLETHFLQWSLWCASISFFHRLHRQTKTIENTIEIVLHLIDTLCALTLCNCLWKCIRFNSSYLEFQLQLQLLAIKQKSVGWNIFLN